MARRVGDVGIIPAEPAIGHHWVGDAHERRVVARHALGATLLGLQPLLRG